MDTTAAKKIVFVIGAGASQEARLPTGLELRNRIRSLLDFEYDGIKDCQLRAITKSTTRLSRFTSVANLDLTIIPWQPRQGKPLLACFRQPQLITTLILTPRTKPLGYVES